MALKTDPAKELADICQKLDVEDGHAGDEFLAKKFGVKAWSKEFYQVLFCIVERADYVKKIVAELDIDDDAKSDAIAHLDNIITGFDRNAMQPAWNQRGKMFVGKINYSPVRMLSGQVRQKVSYPQLSSEETKEVIVLCTELHNWLSEQQLSDNDFVRAALLEGISQFRFRLERIGWFGWGYTVQSLRDVIGAYMVLEHGMPPERTSAPDSEAVAMKVKAFLGRVHEKIGTAREAKDNISFIYEIYGYASLAITTAATIAGLLTGPR